MPRTPNWEADCSDEETKIWCIWISTLKQNQERLISFEQRVAILLACKLNSLWPWEKVIENQTEQDTLKEWSRYLECYEQHDIVFVDYLKCSLEHLTKHQLIE